MIGGTPFGGVDSGGNVIGGNGQNGIGIYGSASGQAAAGTQIAGNTIGFGAPLAALGNNLSGIHIGLGNNTQIGGLIPERMNRISRNGRNGVTVLSGVGNDFIRNAIVDNTLLGIDLGNDGVSANDPGDGDTGPNNRQNFPVLSAVVGGVQGALNSRPNSSYVIYYYSNSACDGSGSGEGENFLSLASVTTDTNGNVLLPLISAPVGAIVTAVAIATDASGTSEFSQCVTVPAAPPQADLALTMTDSADPVAFGTPFNYTITAQNLGPNPAVSVRIVDTLPVGLTATVASASQGTCTI